MNMGVPLRLPTSRGSGSVHAEDLFFLVPMLLPRNKRLDPAIVISMA